MKGSRVQVSDSARKSKVARPETSRKNRRKAICRRFFRGESRLAQRGGLSKAPLRQAAEKRRAKRSQVSDSAQEEEVAPTVRPLFLCPAGLEEGLEGSDSSLGFGSKVQGRKTRDVKEKPPQSNLQAVFSWRIETRAARRTFESAPAASSREKTSEAKSSLGFGSGRGGCTDGATSFFCVLRGWRRVSKGPGRA